MSKEAVDRLREAARNEQTVLGLSELNHQLRAENAELKEQLAMSEANGKHWSEAYGKWVKSDEGQMAIRQAERIAELEQQLADAQADAQRYRWLSCQECDRDIDIALWDGEMWCCNYGSKDQIDAAIDEAMKEKGK